MMWNDLPTLSDYDNDGQYWNLIGNHCVLFIKNNNHKVVSYSFMLLLKKEQSLDSYESEMEWNKIHM